MSNPSSLGDQGFTYDDATGVYTVESWAERKVTITYKPDRDGMLFTALLTGEDAAETLYKRIGEMPDPAYETREGWVRRKSKGGQSELLVPGTEVEDIAHVDDEGDDEGEFDPKKMWTKVMDQGDADRDKEADEGVTLAIPGSRLQNRFVSAP